MSLTSKKIEYISALKYAAKMQKIKQEKWAEENAPVMIRRNIYRTAFEALPSVENARLRNGWCNDHGSYQGVEVMSIREQTYNEILEMEAERDRIVADFQKLPKIEKYRVFPVVVEYRERLRKVQDRLDDLYRVMDWD